MTTTPSSEYMYGLVDMGSNGIRFSITDLTPATARALPVLFQERLGISLYDAQFSSANTTGRGPIPQDVIDRVLVGMKRFKTVCGDFGVPDATNIKVLATEATRTAVNSDEFLKQIKTVTGWDVELLPKEVEGRVGAMGVASSFESVGGIVMDLGGGSTQLTWMIFENGRVQISPSVSVSFPYGAAAMVQLLSDIDANEHHPKKARAELRSRIRQEYVDALKSLGLPDELRQKAKGDEGLTLYLSGGGFRGWGYLLMSRHGRKDKDKKGGDDDNDNNGPYPIPIINGYHASVKEFADIDSMTALIEDKDTDIFRVSNRRASQVPAVAFLVDAITSAFPFITHVRFCQGGVREGYLFERKLTDEIRAQSPLASATSRCTTATTDAGAAVLSEHLAAMLQSALPFSVSYSSTTTAKEKVAEAHNDDADNSPSTITSGLLRAIANTMYVQSNAPKETASLSALHLPITGVLAATHGISHADRALLALTLSRRWDGDLPPPHHHFRDRLQSLLSRSEVWWANYLGAVAGLLGAIYPVGKIVGGSKTRVELSAKWADGLGKKGNMRGVKLCVKMVKEDAVLGEDLLGEYVGAIEKVGKKKNWLGAGVDGKKGDGFGFPVEVDVEWV